MYYIGLDVHKRTISYCVKDAADLRRAPTSTVDFEAMRSFSQNEVRFLSSGRIAGKQEVSQLVDQGESNFRIARDSSEISGIATEFPFPQWSRCSDASQNGSYSSLVTLVFTKM
jgi:hypothetical protein